MTEARRFHVVETDLGWVGLCLTSRGLRTATLPRPTRQSALNEIAEAGDAEPVSSAEADKLSESISAIVAGRKSSDLPVDLSGITPFRRAVLEECRRIPAGETRSYGWLAAKVGRPGAARAVGRVMATNPVPLVIPCHRVVGSTGGLHGFGGGLEMKETLLRNEGGLPA